MALDVAALDKMVAARLAAPKTVASTSIDTRTPNLCTHWARMGPRAAAATAKPAAHPLPQAADLLVEIMVGPSVIIFPSGTGVA